MEACSTSFLLIGLCCGEAMPGPLPMGTEMCVRRVVNCSSLVTHCARSLAYGDRDVCEKGGELLQSSDTLCVVPCLWGQRCV